MAVAALALALATLHARKTRDPKVPPAATGLRAVAPGELPALGYLPDDCNLVAAIHIADILNSATGKKLLKAPQLDQLDKGLAWVASWTGLQVGAIDHVALGTRIGGNVPQLVAVLRTRQPYRLEELARRFPGKAFPHYKRPLFRMKLQPVGGGYVWCADERTLVLLLRPDTVKIEDMDRVPAFPRPAGSALTAAVHKLVTEQIRQADIWAAGVLDQPEALADLLKLVPLMSKLPPPLAQARSFAVGARVDEELEVLGVVRVGDDAGLRTWREFLERLPLPDTTARKIIPAADRMQLDFQLRMAITPAGPTP